MKRVARESPTPSSSPAAFSLGNITKAGGRRLRYKSKSKENKSKIKSKDKRIKGIRGINGIKKKEG